jgi:glycerol-3-phosphate dehydrogenase (NAD(P)+)
MTSSVDVAVVGGGEWGKGLASAAHAAGSKTLLVTRRKHSEMPDGMLHDAALVSAARASLIVLAVPSSHVADMSRELAPHLSGSTLLIHGIRGLVSEELQTVSQIVRSCTPVRRLGALGGPAVAHELAQGLASVMVVGSFYPEVIRAFRDSFASETIRVFGTTDLLALEWASALTGVYATTIGYAMGAGQRAGVLAAFVTRAIHEASRIAEAAGGQRSTLLGMAGMGDLLACLAQQNRPEVMFGRALAQGDSHEQALEKAGQRIEALQLVPRLSQWAKHRELSAPIVDALAAALFDNAGPEQTMSAILAAPDVAGEA